MFRIVTDRIAEGLTLHYVITTSASLEAIAGRSKLKIVSQPKAVYCSFINKKLTLNDATDI